MADSQEKMPNQMEVELPDTETILRENPKELIQKESLSTEMLKLAIQKSMITALSRTHLNENVPS